jgi:putative selenium metabolism hydrolase
MLVAAASLDRAALAGRLVVSASVGEESIEGAALREVMRARPPDFVLIGEATELNLARAGRGRAEFAIRTQGRPAHASSPERGVNAVHKMMRVIERIEALPMPSDPIAGRGVMALTDIISDPYPAHSVVPSGCRATYERRLVPGETREEVTAQLVEAFLAADAPETRIDLATADYTTYAGVEWSEPKWFPPWMLDADHPWLLRSSAALRAAGLAPELRSYQFCTNAAYSAGVAGVPTLGFGPSSEAHAHVVDEFVEIEQLLGAARGYRAIAAATLE